MSDNRIIRDIEGLYDTGLTEREKCIANLAIGFHITDIKEKLKDKVDEIVLSYFYRNNVMHLLEGGKVETYCLHQVEAGDDLKVPTTGEITPERINVYHELVKLQECYDEYGYHIGNMGKCSYCGKYFFSYPFPNV